MSRGEAWREECRRRAGLAAEALGPSRPTASCLRRALMLAWPGGERKGWRWVVFCREAGRVLRREMGKGVR